MDRQTQNELEMIKEKIINAVNPQKIYLFGSYAYGEPKTDSDFDIYVILDDSAERPLLAMQQIGMALAECKRRPVDILANTAGKFAERQHFQSVEKTVAEKGVTLYERQQLCQTMA